jgi:hypothetical protein
VQLKLLFLLPDTLQNILTVTASGISTSHGSKHDARYNQRAVTEALLAMGESVGNTDNMNKTTLVRWLK